MKPASREERPHCHLPGRLRWLARYWRQQDLPGRSGWLRAASLRQGSIFHGKPSRRTKGRRKGLRRKLASYGSSYDDLRKLRCGIRPVCLFIFIYFWPQPGRVHLRQAVQLPGIEFVMPGDAQ